CSGTPANPLFNTLCLENDAFPQPRPPAAAFQILNQNGQPINCPPGSGNTCAATPWGTVDRTFTKGLTTGASLQALGDDKVPRHDNNFVIGASVDRSKIGFLGSSELWRHLPRFVRRSQRCGAGDGRDRAHRRLYRL